MYTRLKSRRDVRRRRVVVRREGNVRGKSIWAPRHWAGVYDIQYTNRALQLNAVRLSEKEEDSPRTA